MVSLFGESVRALTLTLIDAWFKRRFFKQGFALIVTCQQDQLACRFSNLSALSLVHISNKIGILFNTELVRQTNWSGFLLVRGCFQGRLASGPLLWENAF